MIITQAKRINGEGFRPILVLLQQALGSFISIDIKSIGKEKDTRNWITVYSLIENRESDVHTMCYVCFTTCFDCKKLIQNFRFVLRG